MISGFYYQISVFLYCKSLDFFNLRCNLASPIQASFILRRGRLTRIHLPKGFLSLRIVECRKKIKNVFYIVWKEGLRPQTNSIKKNNICPMSSLQRHWKKLLLNSTVDGKVAVKTIAKTFASGDIFFQLNKNCK